MKPPFVFFHHKGDGQGSCPKLCRWRKEYISGAFNLHELTDEEAQAGHSKDGGFGGK